MNKKILSLILALAMVLSVHVSAFAIVSGVTVDETGRAMENYTEQTVSAGQILKCWDYANGDSRFILVVNGNVSSDIYVNRSTRQITSTIYNSKIPSTMTQGYIPVKSSQNVTPYSYTTVGTIQYRYSSGSDSGICGAKCSYEKDINTSDSYDLNGTYRDIASLAAYIAGVLAIPSAIASQFAQWVLYAVGLAGTTAPYFIKEHVVKAVSTTITWKVVNTAHSGHYNTFSGTQYKLIQEGSSAKTKKKGTFYPVSSFKNKDKAFAIMVFDSLFTYTSYTINKWISA